jgi:hypothetical protein
MLAMLGRPFRFFVVFGAYTKPRWAHGRSEFCERSPAPLSTNRDSTDAGMSIALAIEWRACPHLWTASRVALKRVPGVFQAISFEDCNSRRAGIMFDESG